MSWVNVGVVAASMAANYMNNRAAQQRAGSLQQAMQSYQMSKAKQNEQAIGNLVDQQTPAKRGQELQDLQGSRQASMQSTVEQARAASPVVSAPAGASADYQKASTVAADTVAARAKRAIEQQAVMGAPGEASIAQGLRFGRAAGNVDANNDAINNIEAAYSRDIAGVHPNPWIALASKVGMAYGGYMLGGAGAAATSNAAIDAGANNGGGYEDASGNLYNEGVTTRQDARIQRQLKMKRAFDQWGYGT